VTPNPIAFSIDDEEDEDEVVGLDDIECDGV
jgi:hypothetical protein